MIFQHIFELAPANDFKFSIEKINVFEFIFVYLKKSVRPSSDVCASEIIRHHHSMAKVNRNCAIMRT